MRTETSEVTDMYNQKVHVKIGRKYRDAFKSICDLVRNGCIDASVVESCKDDRFIETSQYIFEYTGDPTAIDTGTQVGMMPGGASWFMGFRGGESDSVMGTWHNLIETVATSYHQEYSLVEYVQNSVLRDLDEVEHCKEIVKNIASVLKLPVNKIVDATAEDSVEDLYAVSLRMELFGGAGEPRPVLCKVYFRYRNNTYLPLDTAEAAIVDEYISKIVGGRREAVKQDESNATAIVDNILNSVSKLIEGDLPRSFTDSVLITNETDAATIKELVHLEPQDEVNLQCKKLKVLGISHISWIDTAFSIYAEEKKAFLVKLGLNNTVSLYCSCNALDNKLIEGNVITCTSPETGEVTKLRIEPEEDNLGLTDSEIDRIRSESAFARHFFPITCSELVRRHVECTRYRCECNTLTFEVGGKTRRKCADCPYPEVVHRYGDGNLAYTPTLFYDSQTMSVVDSEPSVCRFCTRSYAAGEKTGGGLCAFCKSAFDRCEAGKAGEQEQATYKRYAAMLPLTVRLRTLFGKKYCFENADRLIFVVGKNRYFFDKLNLTDSGRIEKPEKRQ